MRDPYTSTQASDGGHPDSIGPAAVTVPDTMLNPFTGKQPGRSYALQLGIGVCALGALALMGYEMMLPPTPGSVVMNLRPNDATVSVDGKAQAAQVSPVTIEGLTPDVDHVIEVSKAGFKPHKQTVKLKEAEVLNLDFVTLEPLVVETGFTLDSNPTGATVFIDGNKLQQVTPVKITDLAAGNHTLRVEHGFTHKPWDGAVSPAAGQMLELPVATLTPLSPAEAKKAERLAKLQARRDALKAAKAAKAAGGGVTPPEPAP